MDDRELLELAARAAGICLIWDGIVPKEIIEHWNGDPDNGPETRDWHWNPLEDDGDALRLAVKLEIDVMIWEDYVSVYAREVPELDEYARGGCIYAAARRAIVRAAAEIGRSMP
jgi:hypothetical protein